MAAYAGSQSQSGNQTVLSINTGTVTTPVWTPVGEVMELVESGKQIKTDDVTNLQSLAEEFIPTILSPGTYAVTMNRVSADAGQTALQASFNAVPPTLKGYQVQLPKLPTQTIKGDSYSFTALVEEYNDLGTIKGDKAIKAQVKLKVSGPQTFVPGS